MANQNVFAKILPHVLSETAIQYAEASVGTSAAAADTLTITCPDGVDIQTMPVSAVAINTSAVPYTYQALTLTSFDPTTGKTVLTVPTGGALVAGQRIVMTMFENY